MPLPRTKIRSCSDTRFHSTPPLGLLYLTTELSLLDKLSRGSVLGNSLKTRPSARPRDVEQSRDLKNEGGRGGHTTAAVVHERDVIKSGESTRGRSVSSPTRVPNEHHLCTYNTRLRYSPLSACPFVPPSPSLREYHCHHHHHKSCPTNATRSAHHPQHTRLPTAGKELYIHAAAPDSLTPIPQQKAQNRENIPLLSPPPPPCQPRSPAES